MLIDDILAEQQSYYRQRADQYDDWWFRRSRHDRGADDNAQWLADVAALERWFAGLGTLGDTLELAGGTGLWTRHLAPACSSLRVVDGAPETLEINRARTAEVLVDYQVADIFAYEPDQRFDTIFFSFWISHVPNARWAHFWAQLSRWMKPGGRAIFIDNARLAMPRESHAISMIEGEPVNIRTIDGADRHRIIKHFFTADELRGRIADCGWTASVAQTHKFFLYGKAVVEKNGAIG